MKSRIWLMIILCLVTIQAQAAGAGASFSQGQNQFSIGAGSGEAFDKNYFVVGVSAAHYVIDGLGVGLAADHWSGSGPSINRYTPFLQYVFYQRHFWRPYVGGFFRHTVISGLQDLNSYGGRAGIYIATSRKAYLGIGLVHEQYLSCQEKTYGTCSETYSEIHLIFSF